MEKNKRQLAVNRTARHEYFIEETIEAGLELFGTEVKSIREGKANLKESYCEIDKGEMFIHGMHVSPYEKGNIFNRDPLRVRKLLLHKREIMRLLGKVKQDGYTIIPLDLHLTGQHVKMEIALAKGKKLYDKREDAAKRSAKREIDRAIKERNAY
ncbi:MAG: SsrA-binding protein SmpB [Clostridia bacterium]|nr:SsrA-binding protein SmpB [Clostridia bacterium]MBQ8540793.1 SsrA-binding protein SmpB [Clostridia bacterium]